MMRLYLHCKDGEDREREGRRDRVGGEGMRIG